MFNTATVYIFKLTIDQATMLYENEFVTALQNVFAFFSSLFCFDFSIRHGCFYKNLFNPTLHRIKQQ